MSQNTPSSPGSTGSPEAAAEVQIQPSGEVAASRAPGRAVSVVMPTLGRDFRLRASLPAVVREVETRAIAADEILLVDDSGIERASGTVPEILGSEDGDRRAKVRLVSHSDNLGFAAAVAHGVKEARNPLVLVLHDDVVLGNGALEELVDAFLDPGPVAASPEAVFAAAPRVVHAGPEGEAPPETTGVLTLVDDRMSVFEGEPTKEPESGAAADGPRLASFPRPRS